MSKLKKPKRVKLVIAFFSSHPELLDRTEKILIKKFGKIDFKSNDLNFTETDYYDAEMGNDLKMRFISFKKLVERDSLAAIKIFSINIEKKFSIKINNELKRKINIDPGHLSLENFILATGKPYSHRIYMNKGVWIDLTLIYTKTGFKPLPWTYPNYKSEKVISVLTEIRNAYHNQIKNKFE